MASTIAEKLDYLMKLTDTSNASLARVLSFDASYISRIRAGKRGIPRHQPFIRPTAEYFAKRIQRPEQIRSLQNKAAVLGQWPADTEEAVQYLIRWMEEEQAHGQEGADKADKALGAGACYGQIPTGNAPQDKFSESELFYGREGEREAVKILLKEACRDSAGGELLLYSDEHMAWMTEDTAFALDLSRLLTQFLQSGGKICIIHNINRELSEMLEAVRKWMPLYRFGRMEPYFCPRINDGFHHRTMFIVKDQIALSSGSVGARPENRIHLLTRRPQALSALTEEFEELLSTCRPLMDVYRQKDKYRMQRQFRRFLKGEGSLTVLHRFPLLMHLAGTEHAHTKSQAERDLFARQLERGQSITEILCPITSEKDLEYLVPVWKGFGKGESIVLQSLDEYQECLNTVFSTEMPEGYRLVLASEPEALEEIWIREKEEVWVYFGWPEPIAFQIREPRLSDAILRACLHRVVPMNWH